MLKVLEQPFSSVPGLEQPGWVGRGGASEPGERDEQGEGSEEEEEGGAASSVGARVLVPYDGKPPAWARELSVT